MSNEVMLAMVSLAGSALGVVGGILGANKLTDFRLGKIENHLDELDKKMDSIADNSICEISNRLVAMETRLDIIERR